MKLNWKLPLITGITLVGSLFSGYSQTQEKPNKSSFVDSVMAKAEKYPTTTHFIYEIQKDCSENFHDINKLEKIIKNVEDKFSKKDKYSNEEVVDMLTAINKEIKNLGLKYESYKFDCEDISYIYLAVGEKLNLPLYGVTIPFHMFIRYDPDGKHDALNQDNPINKDDFNWETVDAEIFSDEDYINRLNISKESIQNNSYIKMRNLTKKELISRSYIKRGSAFNDKKNYDKAIEDYNVVIKLNLNDVYAYLFRSITYRNIQETKKSAIDIKKYEELLLKK